MLPTSDKIRKEKSIADAVLERLEVIDPTCILAGGAPRDWWLGITANDLDFYIHSKATTPQLEHSLAMLGLKVTPLRVQGYNVKDRLDNLYNSMPDLRCVYETEYRGKPIQIMVMNQPTFSGVVDKFAVSISKVWYKGGIIRPEQPAHTSIRNREIYVEKGYGPNCRYIQKMRERFPHMAFVYQIDGGLRAHQPALSIADTLY